MQFVCVAYTIHAYLPFHPLFQQLQVDLAPQGDQESLDVLALHLAPSLQSVPVKDNTDICLTFTFWYLNVIELFILSPHYSTDCVMHHDNEKIIIFQRQTYEKVR